MVVSRLIGGLGNQMFQYAAGRSLAVANNLDLKLDVSGFENYALHNGYELSLFNIQADIATYKEVSNFVNVNSRLARFLFKKLRFKNKTHFIEKNFTYDPLFFNTKKPVYIDGYWQSYKYFDSIKQQLKAELTPKKPLTGLNLQLAESINKLNAVSIHIRRGDYINNPHTNKVHGFLGIEYYRNAIEIVFDKVADPYFFVFSDDIIWAKENLDLGKNATFVDHNSGQNSYEDMRLMSLCKHHIIANSSFSWWGAWLNFNSDKIVVAPKKWFSNDTNTSDLIPDLWIRI